MTKVVERNVVVVLVHLVEPLTQSRRRYVELFDKVQLHEHHLHQVENLEVLVVVGVERRQSQGDFNVIRQRRVTDFQELLFHVAMLWQAGFAMWRRIRPVGES